MLTEPVVNSYKKIGNKQSQAPMGWLNNVLNYLVGLNYVNALLRKRTVQCGYPRIGETIPYLPPR